MLKRLFTSKTRIKLLTVFVTNPGEEYFIRELTRKLDEQINSIRRELDNLKKLGFLRTRTKNRKKYYYANEDFMLFDELKSIIIKVTSDNTSIKKDIEKIGNIQILVLSGQFANKATESVDIFIVGEIDKEKLGDFINNQMKTDRPVKYAIMSVEDYKYRVNCKDKFVIDIIADQSNKILINKI